MIWLFVLLFFIAIFSTALMGLHFAEDRSLMAAFWALIALVGWSAFFLMGSVFI